VKIVNPWTKSKKCWCIKATYLSHYIFSDTQTTENLFPKKMQQKLKFLVVTQVLQQFIFNYDRNHN